MVAAERLEGSRLFAHPISAAVMEVLYERGYEEAQVEDFLTRAGIDRAEFDRHFAGKADVTLRVFEAVIDDFEARVAQAYESVSLWPDSLRAAAYEMVRWMRRNSDATWFGMVGVLEGEELGRVRREEAIRFGAKLIDGGRAVAPDPAAVPSSAPLLAVGAIVEILRRQQEGSTVADLVEMLPKLMYAAVRPYLGEEAALRELEIPPPPDLVAEE